jgi:ethanolaminephosphotransferase
VAIILLLRVSRRWNQTGQKHAGASDIAKDYLSQNVSVLWYLVIATYTKLFSRLTRHTFRRIPGRSAGFIFGFATIASALTFKFSFAAQDTPELIAPWLKHIAIYLQELDMSLVSLTRTTFVAIVIIALYTIFFENRAKASNGTAPARVCYVLNILNNGTYTKE